jgi:protein TonB
MLGILQYRKIPMPEALLLDRPIADLVPTIGSESRLRRGVGRSWRLRLAGLLSLVLHAALLAGILLWFHGATRVADAPDQPATVELVLDHGAIRGLTPSSKSAPSADTAAPPVEHAQADEALPLPPVPPPAPPAERSQEAPQITIGGNDSDTNTFVTSFGPYVVPATVDARFHNRNPIYPAAAARLAEEGAVILLIHVSPEGLPSGVDIQETSGYPDLDQAASDAVNSWHFLPAVKDGKPIPFDMPLRIVFHLD